MKLFTSKCNIAEKEVPAGPVRCSEASAGPVVRPGAAGGARLQEQPRVFGVHQVRQVRHQQEQMPRVQGSFVTFC